MTSSVKSRGCGEVNRTRSSPPDVTHERSACRTPPCRRIDAVGVDVLPEQRHSTTPSADERLDLAQDLAGAAVTLTAAQRRHDAESEVLLQPTRC